jgi:hypothetical protein
MRSLSRLAMLSIQVCAAVIMSLSISYAQDFKQMKVTPSQKSADEQSTESSSSTTGPNEEFIENQPQQNKKGFVKQPKIVNPGGREIRCPLGQVQTEITTPLPEGWWNTPQIGNLVRTRVDMIGGELTLMCGYEAYKSVAYIMMRPPAGTTTCKVVGKGSFVCK